MLRNFDRCWFSLYSSDLFNFFDVNISSSGAPFLKSQRLMPPKVWRVPCLIPSGKKEC